MRKLAIKKLEAYKDGWEHIQDELRLLDLRIRLLLQFQHGLQGENTQHQFKGLVISEQEVESLLDQRDWQGTGDRAVEDLRGAIRSMEEYLLARIKLSIDANVFLPLEHLSYTFEFNWFERNCLLLCLAVEYERKYEKIFGFLQDDINCKHPTIDLALKLLCGHEAERNQARMAFNANAPLMRDILQPGKETFDNSPRLSRPLRLDRRILEYFYQPFEVDPSLQAEIRVCTPEQRLEPLLLDTGLQTSLQLWWQRVQSSDAKGRQPLAFICGPSGSGKSFQVQHLCSDNERILFMIELNSIKDDEESFAQELRHIARECIIYHAIPCFKGFDALAAGNKAGDVTANPAEHYGGRYRTFLRLLREFPGPVFVLAQESKDNPDFGAEFSVMQFHLDISDELKRKELWEYFSTGYQFAEPVDWGEMASKFRFTPGQIKNALLQASEMGYGHREGGNVIMEENLHAACFAQGRYYLGSTATKIKPVYTWEDLILPAETVELLMNGCNQMKYRYMVYGQWGFGKRLPYGRGLSMLFSGFPGTGKTMAAQVIARDLNLELYRIDLAQVVSKYIGETEKNLRHIFNEAESSNAILFFDEADALFGKRSEVKDSHDRYANIEIAYLLQKVEEYDGISILATNLAKNLDDAFVRRITFIIEFPFPDADYRKKIWQSMFPPAVPVHQEVDFDFLAKRFEISGGNIKNIVLAAAFLAAQDEQTVMMRHILRAIKYEYQKTGRVLLKEDLGEYYDELYRYAIKEPD